MKPNTPSFLFFCVVLISSFSVFNVHLLSQNVKDSTRFYYGSIREIQDVGMTSKAFDFFKKKVDQSLLKNDTVNAAYYLELISLGQFKMGFTYESESTTIQALRLLDGIKDGSKTMAPRERLSNQLGMLYRKIEDFENSNKFYTQALALSNGHVLGKIAIVNNIANNYADQGQFEKAVGSLQEHYPVVLKMEKSNAKATYLDNLGYYQTKIGGLQGLRHMEQALDIRKDLKDLTGIFSSYRHLSLFYSGQGNKDGALKYANKAKGISDAIGSPTYRVEALGLKLGLEDNADFKDYMSLNKEIDSKNKLRENKFAAIKYNVAKKEKLLNEKEHKLEVSELEKEKQKNLKLFYLSLGSLLTLILVFTIIILKTKHKKDKLKVAYSTETRISKKVHDEVANDVYYAMIKLQKNPNDKGALLDDLEKIYDRTRDISKGIGTVDMTISFNDLLYDLLISYKSKDVSVIANNLSKIDWKGLDDIKRTFIYRVLQELMTNMKKHSQASIVVLSFKQIKSKIQIDYKDNGVGCILIKNNGLQNTENRMASIKGTITFESNINDGFKVKITI